MELYLVGSDDFGTVWPVVRDDLNKALEYSNGRYSEKIVADMVVSNLMQLWLLTNEDKIVMSMVTQILDYPTGLKVCEVFLLGGKNTKEWLEFAVGKLSKWAKSLGCSSIQIAGRKGWEKVLKGWGSVMVMLERPIGEDHE